MRHGSRNGSERARVARWGIDLFIEDGAYTTVTTAVSLLVVLALVLSLIHI